MKTAIREFVRTLIIAAAVYFGLQASLQSFEVRGSSMEPSIHSEQYLVVNKISFLFRTPRRGEVVVVYPPFGDPWIKRIVGIPGDTVEIKEGELYLNGQKVEEPYLREPIRRTFPPHQVPADSYFLLGDNRNSSVDSRDAGPLPGSNIVGKAWFSYWPPGLWGLIPHYTLQPR
jgi:signal peptidase I